jgi:hypothetical protein
MPDSGLGMMAVQMRLKCFQRDMVVVSQKALDAGDATGDVTGGSVDLNPVAGGYDHSLNDIIQSDQVVQWFLNQVGRKGDPFPYFYCCSLVRETDDDNVHLAEVSISAFSV